MDRVSAKAVKNLKCLLNKFTSLSYLFLALFVDWSSILAFIPVYYMEFSQWRSADRISDSGVSYSPVIKFLEDRCSFIFSSSNVSVFPNGFATTRTATNSRFPRQSYLALQHRPLLCSIERISWFFLRHRCWDRRIFI